MLYQQNVKTMYFKTLNPRLFNLRQWFEVRFFSVVICKYCKFLFRVRSIEKSGFRFWISQSNAKSENGFHLPEIRPRGGFQLRNPNPEFLDFPFYRSIWKTVRLACTRIISKKKTAVHKNSFANPFSDSPIERHTLQRVCLARGRGNFGWS